MQIDVIRLAAAIAGPPRTAVETFTWASLGDEWRQLEAAADGSLFQSWTWLGCQVESRFTNPLVLRATLAGRVIGLALFNRTGPWFAPTLWLHQTGRRADDSVFIEHNGPLLARGHQDLLYPMLAAASKHGKLVLSGVDDSVFQVIRSWVATKNERCFAITSRPSPFIDLTPYPSEQTWLASLSASTRYRLRRSQRSFERAFAVSGLAVQTAADVSQALIFLQALAVLHQQSWVARGQPGAFSVPAFMDFHRALVERGLPRGEVQLLRVFAPDEKNGQPIGYLYNLRWRDKIYAYQSGFDYRTTSQHQLPGMTCHHMAIAAALTANIKIYDFMAGAAQYKTSLTNSGVPMHWLVMTRRRTLQDLWQQLHAIFRKNSLTDAWLPPPHDGVTVPRAKPAKLARRKITQRLGWPLSAAIIGVLSAISWIVVVYVVWSVL
jgi:CelD/BcsL family acetyltransferase involved in cellulose biosynthesis